MYHVVAIILSWGAIVNGLLVPGSPLSLSKANQQQVDGVVPIRDGNMAYTKVINKAGAFLPLAAALILSPKKTDAAAPPSPISSLGKEGYTKLGDMTISRILTGMWQVSGAHGYEPEKNKAVGVMKKCVGKICREVLFRNAK
jgi:hypothetical protein